MANKENLIPLNKRTQKERIEIAKKGAAASARVRKQKATFKKAFQTMLEIAVPIPELKARLEGLGIAPTTRNAATFTSLMTAISKGDINAIKTIMDIVDESKSMADRKEQSARIKRMQAETARIEEETARKNGTQGEEEAREQTESIARLINNPSSQRVIQDFLNPSGGDTDDTVCSPEQETE